MDEEPSGAMPCGPPPSAQAPARPRVVIVGGGASAACLVVQLVRYTGRALEIDIVEPRPRPGPGLAYSASDPDHRLNAPLDIHWLDPGEPFELRRWCEAKGLFERDPECFTSNGQVFLRRGDLGTYLTEQIRNHAADRRLGSTIRHVRDTATSARFQSDRYVIGTAIHGDVPADMLFVATGNPVPSLRRPFLPHHADDPRIIANPLDPGALDRIHTHGRVLVLGSGLTALDAVSTLARRQHQGGVLVVSRRGLRPRSQAPDSLRLPPPERIVLSTTVPPFIAGEPSTIRAWTAALRREIAQAAAAGQSWHASLDAIRNVVGQLWPHFPDREKLRFMRQLRVFYDVHRFRTPPMNDTIVGEAEQQGLVRFGAATITAVDLSATAGAVGIELRSPGGGAGQWQAFDFVVNCTGLDAAAAWQSNAFLRSLLEQGLVRLHPTGIGFDVTDGCEAVDVHGVPQPRLRMIGPPTAGVFGDPVAIPFIANQVQRILPHVLGALGDTGA